MLETLESLKKENLRFVGAGESEAGIDSPLYVEIKGIRIAFLAFTAISPGNSASKIALATTEKVKRAVTLTRRNADAVIVSFHWGTEYDSRPNLAQIKLANAAIEAGAAVVLGHHPHVLQGFQLIEKTNGERRRALIAYSLGNFVFDSPVKIVAKTAESVILKIQVDKNGFVMAEAVPIVIENYRPVLPDENRKLNILSRLNSISGDLMTEINENGLIKEAKSFVNYAGKEK